MRYGPPFRHAHRSDGRRVAGSGFRFADRGTHRLKGIPDDWQLYAVELAEG
jgi:hypothetical protein